jgi:hypothetical protein
MSQVVYIVHSYDNKSLTYANFKNAERRCLGIATEHLDLVREGNVWYFKEDGVVWCYIQEVHVASAPREPARIVRLH